MPHVAWGLFHGWAVNCWEPGAVIKLLTASQLNRPGGSRAGNLPAKWGGWCLSKCKAAQVQSLLLVFWVTTKPTLLPGPRRWSAHPHPRPQTPNTPISDLISPLPLTHSVRNTGLFAIGSCTHCSLCLKCYSPDGSLPIQNSPSQRGLSCRMLTARGQGCVVNGEMLVRGYKRPLIRWIHFGESNTQRCGNSL